MANKRNNPKDKSVPHIGQMVREYLDQNKITYSSVAKKAGWSRSTMTKLLNKRNWNSTEVITVGKILNLDLTAWQKGKNEEATMPVAEFEKVVKENVELKAENAELKEELAKVKYALEIALKMGGKVN